MNKFLSGLMATALVGSFAIASVMPANAAPVYVPKSEQVRTDVEQVNHTRRHWRIQQERRAYRAERRADRWDRRSVYREDRYGHSIYRKHHRRHWRDHNDDYRRDNGGVRLELSF
jgi:hypothetical protein